MARSIRTALVSTFDKGGVVDFCRQLQELDVRILSSGGTARLLEENGLRVIRVPEYTGFPEMLDGRVKTLHPKIHAGILAVRSNAAHMADLERHGIDPIDLVVVNLYPFEKTASRPDATLGDAVEMIDIGGPAMVRAAAKNFEHVGTVVDPADYADVIAEIRDTGELSRDLRRRLAVKAFEHTSAYDAAVHAYLAGPGDGGFPDSFRTEFTKVQDLRYGENPHQKAAFYREAGGGPSVATARKVQGKELSFNNILDLDAALGLALDLRGGGCAIIKHGNPCGAALGSDPETAFRRALECDPVSAFGGVIAFNRLVGREAARAVTEAFYEAVIAPDFDAGALDALRKKKNLRVLATGDLSSVQHRGYDLRRVNGGLLVQDWDRMEESVRDAEVATRRRPTEDEWKALEFAWTVCRHVKSNAIVYAAEERTVGIGAGQMSRVDSARFGIQKARLPLKGAVMASDAFFPFRDGVDVAAEAGIVAVVQPGGSIRDEEVVKAADEHAMAMVLTGRRHFRH